MTLTITQLRENIRAYFDAAANGEIVTIQRGGLRFYLVSERDIAKLTEEVTK